MDIFKINDDDDDDEPLSPEFDSIVDRFLRKNQKKTLAQNISSYHQTPKEWFNIKGKVIGNNWRQTMLQKLTFYRARTIYCFSWLDLLTTLFCEFIEDIRPVRFNRLVNRPDSSLYVHTVIIFEFCQTYTWKNKWYISLFLKNLFHINYWGQFLLPIGFHPVVCLPWVIAYK